VISKQAFLGELIIFSNLRILLERENGFIIENENFIIDNSIENEHFIIKSQNAIFKNILLLLIQITYHYLFPIYYRNS
jgi:hypothetical protein